MKKYSLFLAVLLYQLLAHAQTSPNPLPVLTRAVPDFAAFADSCRIRMVKAYQQRDIPSYRHLLDEFNARWDKLDRHGQKTYSAYHIDAWYNLACTYALVNKPIQALDCLDSSLRADYTNYTHIVNDPDLITLHNTQRYQDLLSPLREVGDYPYILEKGARYDPKDHRPFPSFQYQPSSDSPLVALRKGLDLDSIAGGGSDVNRVIRLLHWMHDLIPHDGNHANPAVRNAMSLVAVCKREHRGLNCRGLAIALNECYLALGYRSRYVTCMPKDSLGTDPDCHVINTVFIPSLNKWIWIDPTNDAYVMNEKGELLGIEEVRERLITHQPLIVNPDANWNHRSAVTKEDYLEYYMSKNLYRLICPVNSTYDLETPAKGKSVEYIQLLPLDYFRQQPNRTTFNTNNPTLFWAAPHP